MVGVVIIGVVEIGHVQLGRLALHALTDKVDELLLHDVVVHAVHHTHHAGQQRDGAEDSQRCERVHLHTQHHGIGPVGDGVHQELEDIQIQQRQRIQDQHVDDAQPERPAVALPNHIQCFEYLFHSVLSLSFPETVGLIKYYLFHCLPPQNVVDTADERLTPVPQLLP